MAVSPHKREGRRAARGGASDGESKSKGLRFGQVTIVAAVLIQSVAIIALYERTFQRQAEVESLYANNSTGITGVSKSNDAASSVTKNLGIGTTNMAITSQRKPAVINWEETGYSGSFFENTAQHTTPNPGGLILSASFSYRQDPREVHRRHPLPHILPTFENMYHFHTTVNEFGLHAIIFHDKKSFNETFVQKHTSDHVKFVLVEEPTFDNGEPIISPNDFRYVVFDKWLKANSKLSHDGEMITVNGIKYNWFLISDLDIFFNRNPFERLDEYASKENLTFFGSFDGGIWANEQVSLQRKLFRKCYGHGLFKDWSEDLEWATRNGNCGLWAGRYRDFSCVLDCMAHQYDISPVKGKGESTICDMVTHDYCVHYGGCFPGSQKGTYDQNKVGVLWGEGTQGHGDNLFGPTYMKGKQCDRPNWTVVHNRCTIQGPICFRRGASGELEKYHQPKALASKSCRLDPVTYLPLDVPELVKKFNITV